MTSISTDFNYEKKLWGASTVTKSIFDLNSLKLIYTLEDIESVKGKILDIGCGAGGMTRGVKNYRRDLKVAGVDISESAIGRAKRLSRNVDFQLADVMKFPERFKNSFDAVMMYDVLEHLENPQKALENINKVLKKGGAFSFFVPLDGSLATIHGWLRKIGFIPKLKYAGHVQQFSEKEVVGLLGKSGFRVERRRFSQYLFSQIVDILYFIILFFRGKNVPYSVETYVNSKRSIWSSFLWIFKSLISVVSHVESLIFSFLPGLGLHVKAVKYK